MTVTSGTLTAIHCRFNNNFAGKGGGLYCLDGDLTLIDCIFFDNLVGDRGEGACLEDSNAELINCVFQATTAR